MRLVKHKFPCSIGNSKKLKNAVRGSTALKIMLIFAFITFSLAATVASAAPDAPIVLTPSTGNFWVTHNWEASTGGDVTDSYQIYYDDEWHDVTETSFTHTLSSHATSTIKIVAYNSNTSTISSEATSTAQVPNNPISITDVSSSVSITLGETVSVDASFTDLDGDTPTFSCSRIEWFSDFDTTTGTGSWTPDVAGAYSVDIGVSDGYGSTDSQTMEIIVTRAEDTAPVLSSIGSREGVVNHPLSFTISATDPDGDDVTYSLETKPDGATIGATSGIFSWTPTSTGRFYVNFVATANGLKDSEQIRIEVNEDSAPVLASIGSKNGNEGELLSFTISATDPNGDDIITYSANNLPGGATIDSTTGAFRWTPDYDSEGTYNVEFIASSYGLTDSESITITVNNVDRPPVLDSIGNKAVSENEFLSFNISANDPDGDTAITYSARNLPEGATFNPGTATFSWTPGYNDSDNYDVEFIANSNGLTDSETITITVGDYNRPPELSSIGSKSVKEGDKLTITLSATDYDSDDLTYSVQNMPDNATFNTTGKFIWTPESGDAGTYHVLFSVSDGTTDNSENVTITVTVPSSSSGGGGSSGSSSSSSSSGGGGALTSAEEYDNIALKDYALKMSVIKDAETVFTFGKVGNSIDSVSFTPNVNGGQAKVVVEMLQSTSSQVGSAAPGDVYKNMNILLDTSLVPAAIKKINIVFKVEKSWVNASDINVSNIVLCRYSGGEWGQLATEMKEDDADYFYFKSETPGFSSFAISSIDTSLASTLSPTANTVSIPQLEDSLMSTADSAQMELDLEASPKSTSAFGFVVVLILAGIGIIYWAVRLE